MRNQRYSMDQWQEFLEKQQASGQSIEQFCTKHRLGISTFNRWRRRFEVDATARERPTSQQRSFVEAVPRPRQQEQPCVCLALGSGGVELSIPVAIGAEEIARITQAVVTHARR